MALAHGGIAAAFAFAIAVIGAPAGTSAANGNTPINYHEAIVASPIPIEAKPFVARLTYDATSKDLKVCLKPPRAGYPEKLVLEHTVDLAAEVGASSAYVGFTGSTGGVLSKQDIYSWSLSTPGA